MSAAEAHPWTLPVDPGGIPESLRALDQWTGWRLSRRNGEWTKTPVDASTGATAKSNDPDTWTGFEATLSYMKTHRLSVNPLSGVGFMFHPADGLAGVDLDDCRDPQSGAVAEWAREIVSELDSYAEVSPSATGIKVFLRGELPSGRKRRGSIEMYDRGRFFTVTGHRAVESPAEVRDAQEALTALHLRFLGERNPGNAGASSSGPAEAPAAEIADAELLEMARHAANGAKFSRLYFDGNTAGHATPDNDGRSEADLALASLLAFWCGPDEERIDRLFRGSALYRRKWDEVHYADGRTYGQGCTGKAIERTEFWSGRIRLSRARRVRRPPA